VQASLARGEGGDLNPNARGLTEQVRGCPHRRQARRTAKVPVGDAVVLQRFLFGDVDVLQRFLLVT
jgi:hypothetical protein